MAAKKNTPLTGRLLFNMRGGGARLVGENDELLAWITEGDTGVGFHGDRVEVVRTQGDRGRVVKLVKRVKDTFVGSYQKDREHTFLAPDEPRMPFNILIKSGGPSLPRQVRAGDKIVVKLEPWTDPRTAPVGRIIELLGGPTDKGVDMLSIIRTHDIATDFPAACEKEAASFPDGIPQSEIARRVDCRGQFVLTIDPDDAKDHDDAISVERTATGFRATVHIADVAHFVRPGTALDREARKRGNSTYLADRTIPMLPFRLSADLCSLRAGVDRLAHSVFFEYTAQGKVKKVSFAKTVICVHARLTYRQAYEMLQGGKVAGFGPDVAAAVKTAWELASMLRRQRFAAGSLEMDFPEVKVYLDEMGRAERIEKIVNDESHQLIEEFMLAANEAVAAEIKNRPSLCVYRIHEKPESERLNDFRQYAATLGMKVGDLTQRREVVRMLAAIKGRPDEHRLKLEFLKSLKRAAYAPDPVGHYGLAKADYLHFTSPIRRYADLLAHRVLARERVGGRKELEEVSKHISETERTSADAERDSRTVKRLEYFQRQLDSAKPDEFAAFVSDVKSHGLLIELPDVDTVGFVPAVLLPDGPYDFDSPRLRFVNRRSKQVFKLGDRFKVIVVRVDNERRTMDFSIVKGTHQTTATPAAPTAPEPPARDHRGLNRRQPERSRSGARQRENGAKKGARGGRGRRRR
jgi:ribonuclease R